ncbi:MAG: hypothetical protein Unbinned7865contig1001_4 [Prokaryotic dsDNA virus sp.]|nr:MAG: hypothetical protein Unbinned7865contig1001_4 [Prokaryotic dsDNA virus sp.]|tara:strand:- start:21327 stop:21779 length:453 start_codon:yes stop_codon:yes gene_type:complete
MTNNRTGTAWWWIFRAAAVAIILAIAVPAFAYEVARKDTRGGFLADTLRQIAEAERTNIQVSITGRRCASSCTMWLTYRKTCVARRTKFQFHCYSVNGTCSPKWNTFAAQRLASVNPALGEWFLKEVAGSQRLRTVTGETFINLGAKECE